MPSTFTHPLAVLPFRRFCPSPLNLAALVIGSMSPDFRYFVHQFAAASFAHTLTGTLTLALPSGLVALGLFYLLRRPLCFILPQPHRSALTPLTAVRPSLGFKSLLGLIISVLIGIWSHTVWDSFTHPGAWSAERIALLREPLFSIAGNDFRGSYLLQQLSTFGGGAALVWIYFSWLRRQPASPPPDSQSFSDWQRYGVLVVIILAALGLALPPALRMASNYEGYLAFRVLVFRTVVYGAAAFVPLLVCSAILLYFMDVRKHGRFFL